MNREDVDCCESSVYVTDDGSLDSVWMIRDQSRTPQPLLDSKLSEEKSRHTQDSELSLTLLCYTESKPTDTQDTTVCDSKQSLQEDQTSTESLDSDCNAGEQQQILQTKLKMNIMMKIKTEPTEIKTEPTEIKTEPTDIKTEPTEIKTEPTEIKTEPTEIKTEPTEIKTEPTEIKTEPTEIKTEPTEIKTEPTEIKTEPTETKTEPTKVEDRTKEDDDFIPSEKKPEGGRKRKSVFEVAEKRRKLSEERNQTRVVLGETFQRWRAMKEQRGVRTDAQFAKILLDSFETVTSTPLKHQWVRPQAPAVSTILPESLADRDADFSMGGIEKLTSSSSNGSEAKSSAQQVESK